MKLINIFYGISTIFLILIISVETVFARNFDKALEHLAIIEKTYNPAAYGCIPPVNTLISNPILADERYQLACLLAGFRSIVITEKKIVKDLLGSDIHEILTLKNIQMMDTPTKSLVYDVILFTPQGKKSALLLSQCILQNPNNMNDYLWGTLLGYEQEQVKFFYQLNGFEMWLRENGYEGELPSRDKYTLWPNEMHIQFNNFKQYAWKNSKEYTHYQKDKELFPEQLMFAFKLV